MRIVVRPALVRGAPEVPIWDIEADCSVGSIRWTPSGKFIIWFEGSQEDYQINRDIMPSAEEIERWYWGWVNGS